MNFSDLGLCPELSQAVADLRLHRPDPDPGKIDTLRIDGTRHPRIGADRDRQDRLLHAADDRDPRLRTRQGAASRSLILAPTRELAAQVADSFEKFSTYHKLSMALLIGG